MVCCVNNAQCNRSLIVFMHCRSLVQEISTPIQALFSFFHLRAGAHSLKLCLCVLQSAARCLLGIGGLWCWLINILECDDCCRRRRPLAYWHARSCLFFNCSRKAAFQEPPWSAMAPGGGKKEGRGAHCCCCCHSSWVSSKGRKDAQRCPSSLYGRVLLHEGRKNSFQRGIFFSTCGETFWVSMIRDVLFPRIVRGLLESYLRKNG